MKQAKRIFRRRYLAPITLIATAVFIGLYIAVSIMGLPQVSETLGMIALGVLALVFGGGLVYVLSSRKTRRSAQSAATQGHDEVSRIALGAKPARLPVIETDSYSAYPPEPSTEPRSDS